MIGKKTTGHNDRKKDHRALMIGKKTKGHNEKHLQHFSWLCSHIYTKNVQNLQIDSLSNSPLKKEKIFKVGGCI
jgi:hypothetical protein